MAVLATIEVHDVGTLLRWWRTEAGLNMREASEKASAQMGVVRGISHGTIFRYENNEFGASGPDPVYLAALAVAYGRKITDLPEEYLKRCESLVDFLTRNRWSSASPQRVA